MPRPWTGNKPIFVRLAAAEIDLLKQGKSQKKLSSLSAVLEAAILAMVNDVDLKHDTLWMLVPRGNLIPRSYMLSPETIRQLNEAIEHSGFRLQDVIRAAVGRLSRT